MQTVYADYSIPGDSLLGGNTGLIKKKIKLGAVFPGKLKSSQ